MPKRDELSQLLYGKALGSYSLSVQGTPALLRSEVVTQDELAAGDKVKMFSLPGGRTFVSRVDPNSEDAYTIGRITLGHIYFDNEMTVKEK